jgi:hypothetical protein
MKVRVNDRAAGCTELDKAQRMTGFLYAAVKEFSF